MAKWLTWLLLYNLKHSLCGFFIVCFKLSQKFTLRIVILEYNLLDLLIEFDQANYAPLVYRYSTQLAQVGNMLAIPVFQLLMLVGLVEVATTNGIRSHLRPSPEHSHSCISNSRIYIFLSVTAYAQKVIIMRLLKLLIK